MVDEEPKIARKQLVSKDNGKSSSQGKIKITSNKEKTVKTVIYLISALLGISLLLMTIASCPLAPLGKVKEEYEAEYSFMPDEDKRIEMREGLVDLEISMNTSSMTGGAKTKVTIGWHSYLLLAMVFGLGPVSFYNVRKRRKIEKIEERLSDFLRDVSESMRAGQTLHEAIKTSSGGEYGSLTPEIQKMAMQVSWGVSASKALVLFGDRVNTPLVKRSVTLINEASSAGGNVSNVIDAAAKDTREIQIMKKTRATEMNMYTYVIGISFLVFIVVIGIMFATFMPTMMDLSESYQTSDSSSSSQAPGGFDPTNVDFQELKLLLFAAAAIQAIGDGIVGGLMSTGRVWNGVFMASIFALVTWLIFDLALL